MSEYQGYALQMAAKYGIPGDLFLRQINQESGWNPRARSSANAMGLGQIIPSTAKYLGITDPYDPHQSLDGAARYLKEQYETFGNWEHALAAYNAGPGAVKKYGGVPPYKETRNYVRNIMGGADLSFNLPAADPGVPTPPPGLLGFLQEGSRPDSGLSEDSTKTDKWDLMAMLGQNVMRQTTPQQAAPVMPRQAPSPEAFKRQRSQYLPGLMALLSK